MLYWAMFNILPNLLPCVVVHLNHTTFIVRQGKICHDIRILIPRIHLPVFSLVLEYFYCVGLNFTSQLLLILFILFSCLLNLIRQELLLVWKLMTKCHSMSIMITLVQITLFMSHQVIWKIKIHDKLWRSSNQIFWKIFQSFNMRPASNFKNDHLILSLQRCLHFWTIIYEYLVWQIFSPGKYCIICNYFVHSSTWFLHGILHLSI